MIVKRFIERFIKIRSLLRITSIGAVVLFAAYTVRWIARPTFGFGMYYTYSRLLLEGSDFSRVYDFDYFNSRMHEYGIATIDMPNNLPTAALPMLPIAWLDPVLAKSIWTLVSIALLAWSLKILFDVFNVPLKDNLALGLITFAFLFRPVYEGIALGQMYFLILWLFCLSIAGVSKERTARTAGPLWLALMVKGYGIVQLIWFALRRNGRVPLMVLLSSALSLLLSLPFVGIQSWLAFFHTSSQRGAAANAHVNYQSVNGFLHHLFTFDKQWSSSPLIVFPQWTVLILSCVVAFILIYFVVDTPKRSDPKDSVLSYSASIAVGVLVFPMASEYHYVLFLPLIIGLAANLYRQYLATHAVPLLVFVFGASALIIASPIKYTALQVVEPPLSLLAYPKLYAGIALILCFRVVMREKKAET